MQDAGTIHSSQSRAEEKLTDALIVNRPMNAHKAGFLDKNAIANAVAFARRYDLHGIGCCRTMSSFSD